MPLLIDDLSAMALLVQKYGGSSLATPAHIRRAAGRIRDLKCAGFDVVVVVSAMGRMTDHLIRLAGRTVKNPPQRELDMLMTAGERVSMALLAMAIEDIGIPAISFTGSQSGIVTTSDHNEARIKAIRGFRIQEELKKGKVVIVAGFQGVSEQKEITTLGRGGSDTTAVAMAAVLGAQECEILTDVAGLYSADPRLVPSARLLPLCGYDEALELASLGAKMHPRSLEVAKRFGVKVRITSSFDPTCEGTRLVEIKGDAMEETTIRGVATRDGYHFFCARVTLPALLDILKTSKMPLRFFLCGTEVRFACEKEKAEGVSRALSSANVNFEEIPKVCVVSVVGDGLSTSELSCRSSCARSPRARQSRCSSPLTRFPSRPCFLPSAGKRSRADYTRDSSKRAWRSARGLVRRPSEERPRISSGF